MIRPSSSHSCQFCAHVYARAGLPPMQLLSLFEPPADPSAAASRLQPVSPESDGSQHCAAITFVPAAAEVSRTVALSVMHVEAAKSFPPPSSATIGCQSGGPPVPLVGHVLRQVGPAATVPPQPPPAGQHV